MASDDSDFRRGACHGAQFLRDEVKRMAASGLSSSQISERTGHLVQVLLDWRADRDAIDNPWEWGQERIDAYIEEMKDKW